MGFEVLQRLQKHTFSLIAYSTLAYFSYLMLLITWQYVPIDFEVAFLRVKQEEIALVHYQFAFFIHVYTSIFVLLAGAVQLSPRLRSLYPGIHRSVGITYVLLILLFAGPSGVVMGFYANGGWTAQTSFILLAVLWLYFTYQAYAYAKQRQWQQHQHWMWRSYALTLSAISLRLFKWGIVHTLALPPMDTYRIVAWAGWLVNLAVVEILILQKVKHT